jgi:leucyl-tRNA---protein transferase
MRLSIIPLPENTVECGYFPDRQFTAEHFLAEDMGPVQLEALLSRGFRHFGRYFFRPVCADCGSCVPIRVDLRRYRTTRSAKRLHVKNRGADVSITPPEVSAEAFELYKKHKRRFSGGGTESLDQFTKAFFYPMSGSRQLSMYLRGTLIAVGHFDETENALSAVYSYYDDAYADKSLGTYTVNRLIHYGRERGKQYLYLGYYIEENRHMRYKSRYYPNEISTGGGAWLPFVTASGERVNEEALRKGFTAAERSGQ